MNAGEHTVNTNTQPVINAPANFYVNVPQLFYDSDADEEEDFEPAPIGIW